jgi:hypothetical protein
VRANHQLGHDFCQVGRRPRDRATRRHVDIPFTLKGIEAMNPVVRDCCFRAERRAGVWRLSGLDAVYLRD